ncbi:MAG: hypothetical protein ACYCXW_18035, partial [Solirubrobacteraceae bacterium]
MTAAATAHAAAGHASAALARRFEAVIFDWDAIAVPDGGADASRIRAVIERATAHGLELALISRAHIDDIDGQLAARPVGPGGIILALNGGTEVFSVDREGTSLIYRREATAREEAALWRAARLTVDRLADRGLVARIVSEQPNGQLIELIPEQELAARLASGGIAGLAEVAEVSRTAATESGLPAPRITCDVKHVEIGLTDKSDSGTWAMQWLWRRGIAPEQVVAFPGGRADALVALLEDQIARRERGELPIVVEDPEWALTIEGADPPLERVHESLVTLADGRLGTRGTVLGRRAGREPTVLMSGIYARAGAETHLLAAPRWNEIVPEAARSNPGPRVLDLRAGLLHERSGSAEGPIEALLFSSLARPAIPVLRAKGRVPAVRLAKSLEPPSGDAHEEGEHEGVVWMRVMGQPASIAAAAHDQIRGDLEDRVLDRIAAYEASPEGMVDPRLAVDRVRAAMKAGFDALLAEHRRAWAQRWEDADVRIEGDPQLQLAVRFALFHLIGSVPDEGEAAVGARGLSG